MKIIEIKKLEKSYQNNCILTIPQMDIDNGKTYLIVGENGSGKSTLIKLLLDIYLPTKGTINILKNDSIGYVPEKIILPNHLQVEHILCDIAKLRNMEDEFAQKRISSLLKEWDLDPTKKISELSKGMLQKLLLIQAILHYPKWYFFDEPLNGFDLESQKKFILLVKQLKLHKKTIFIASHYPKYYQKWVDKIWNIHNGQINETSL